MHILVARSYLLSKKMIVLLSANKNLVNNSSGFRLLSNFHEAVGKGAKLWTEQIR